VTGMSIKMARRFLERENRLWPRTLARIPRERWPDDGDSKRVAVFRSSKYLVQVFEEKTGIRLSINRTALDASGDWDAGLSWDELQIIKSELGYGDWYGVEVYPRDRDIVNVANMRHLWLMQEPLQIGWFAS
jgi:hypothetical protein